MEFTADTHKEYESTLTEVFWKELYENASISYIIFDCSPPNEGEEELEKERHGAT